MCANAASGCWSNPTRNACCLPCRPIARGATSRSNSRATVNNCKPCFKKTPMENSLQNEMPPPLLKRLGWGDWGYVLLLLAGALFAWQRYGSAMDGYEQGFLLGAVFGFSWLGWSFGAMRWLVAGIALL